MARTRVCFSLASFLVVAVGLLLALNPQPVVAQDCDSSDQALTRDSDHSTASLFYFTDGKYHVPTIEDQWDRCQGGVCDGCLRENFGGFFNPFSIENGPNCNGMLISTAVLEGWASDVWDAYPWDGWAEFVVFSQKDVLRHAIDACNQNWGQHYCLDISGAYLLGSEYSFAELDLYIDRFETGYPIGPCPDDFTALEPYIWSALATIGDPSYREWEVIMYGAMLYLAQVDVNPPAAQGDAGDGQSSSDDVELALKIMAHSMVAMCSWEGTWPELLTENGIEPFCFEVYCTPSYVYRIQMAYDHIVSPWVGNEPMSWGAIKAIYR